jgi:MYXO-CTERM domain-containing protein
MLCLRNFLAALGLLALSQLALAAPVSFSGTLSADDPTYNRSLSGSPPSSLSAVGTAVSYDVLGFHVTASGSYLMEILSASLSNGSPDDTFIALYQDAFDPTQALLNIVEADDDAGLGLLSRMSRALDVGTSYFLVITSFNNGQLGDYAGRFDTVAGDGQVVIDAVPNGVPEPSTVLLGPAALAAAALTRRRRPTAL